MTAPPDNGRTDEFFHYNEVCSLTERNEPCQLSSLIQLVQHSGLVRFLFDLRTETQAPSNGFIFNQRKGDDRNVKYRRKSSVKGGRGARRAKEQRWKRQEINKRRNRHVNHSSTYVEQLATMNKEKDYRKERNAAKGKI